MVFVDVDLVPDERRRSNAFLRMIGINCFVAGSLVPAVEVMSSISWCMRMKSLRSVWAARVTSATLKFLYSNYVRLSNAFARFRPAGLQNLSLYLLFPVALSLPLLTTTTSLRICACFGRFMSSNFRWCFKICQQLINLNFEPHFSGTANFSFL